MKKEFNCTGSFGLTWLATGDIDMIQNFLASVAKFFTADQTQNHLDAYIAARNPQDAGDVERLEREFQAKYTCNWCFPYK